jgi:hypothetical protein
MTAPYAVSLLRVIVFPLLFSKIITLFFSN